ncbi:MAG: hypothetical protein ACKOBD_01645 [Chloroflexota bacterium]
MATGQQHRIPRGNKIVTYTEYQLQPGDANKGLKQIAREQLKNESLYVDILLITGTPNAQGTPWYQEIVNKDRIGGGSHFYCRLPVQVLLNPSRLPRSKLGHFLSPKSRTSARLQMWEPAFFLWDKNIPSTNTTSHPSTQMRMA